MASVDVNDLNKQFGQTRVLKGVSLAIPEGAFAVLVGPSGCGKSTLLRLLAGLEQADSGTIRFGDRDVTRLPPRDRDIAMVFQSYALYPHLTVRENLAFGLSLRKASAAEIDARVREASAMLGLEPLLDRLPRMLSGGQRQRVAMGRAIVRRPGLFLFDEPLSNLDAALRSQVRVDIRKLHDRLGATSVYVTHDQVEAMTLADVMFVLNKGVVEQAGAPLDIYANPATRFVAGFMGMPAMNFFEGVVTADRAVVSSGGVTTPIDDGRFADGLAPGREITVGVRPHDVRLVAEGEGAPLPVTIVEALGTESFAHGSLGGGGAPSSPASRPRRRCGRATPSTSRSPPLTSSTARPARASAPRSHEARSLHGALRAPRAPPAARPRRAHPPLARLPRRRAGRPGRHPRPVEGRARRAVSIPYDAYNAKLAAAIPLGDGPDLFIDEHKRLGDFRYRKLVAPVGDALEPGVFSAPALAAVRDGDVAWAVPLSNKCVALYVNTALVDHTPADLEGMADLAGKLGPGVVPLAFETRNAYYVAAILSAFGGALIDDQDRFGFVGPDAVRAVELDRWLIEKHAAPEDADGALVTDLFGSGQAAFAISGPWLAASLGGKNLRYRVEQLPRVRATGLPMRPLLGVESVMLSPAGAAKPEVRALARLLAGKDAAVIRARYGTPSARSDVVMPEGPVRAFAEQALTAIPMPSSRAMTAAWDPANRAIRKVLRRDVDTEVALAEAKHRYDDVRRPLPGGVLPATGALPPRRRWACGRAFRWIQLARAPGFRAELRRSLPAYAYVDARRGRRGRPRHRPARPRRRDLALRRQRRRAPLRRARATSSSILTARGGPLLATGSFYLTLLVTVLWTACNVALHVGIGLALGSSSRGPRCACARSTACSSSCPGRCRATSPRSRGRACSTASSAP